MCLCDPPEGGLSAQKRYVLAPCQFGHVELCRFVYACVYGCELPTWRRDRGKPTREGIHDGEGLEGAGAPRHQIRRRPNALFDDPCYYDRLEAETV